MLQLANNQFSELSDNFIEISNLRILSLLNNKLFKLPNNIGLLQHLKNIDVVNNQMEILPMTSLDLNMLNLWSFPLNLIFLISQSIMM